MSATLDMINRGGFTGTLQIRSSANSGKHRIQFRAQSSTGVELTYARIFVNIVDNTNAEEDSTFGFNLMVAGNLTNVLDIDPLGNLKFTTTGNGGLEIETNAPGVALGDCDNDGTPDHLEPDFDDDVVPDDCDNCPNVINLGQEDVEVSDATAVWRFDEGSGTVAFDTFANLNGTINGALHIAGQVNTALDFNGTTDHMTHVVQVGTQGSLVHWLRPDQIRPMAAYYESDGTGSAEYNGFGHSQPIREIMGTVLPCAIIERLMLELYGDGPSRQRASHRHGNQYTQRFRL